MHKEYINARCIARSLPLSSALFRSAPLFLALPRSPPDLPPILSALATLANAKLTSALSPRNAKSLKRVLSGKAKLSLYPSDSYPIHYTAGYPIYYAPLHTYPLYLDYAAPTDNFI